ncbi:GGDEF domain-containing protein [Psychrosphaera algicola]|uniref:GGDEF domain-containing protein n=2 Tax=Psychrosphaera TaxID=907197 RepID=A0ABT5FDB2_9GAMM|nr:GGDEF domain-containing protein [Psychrosphaera sp. G1-22]MDC2889525.1 GGDEF domain-containing protein [Psychrosphaera sp. G1-22]
MYTTYLPHISKTTGEVVGMIVMAKDVTEFKRAEGLLSKSANTDALTNIPNRLFLENKLSKLTKSTARRSDRFALMFCDLDGFKQVNDTYGHAVGDKILYQVANRLNKLVRDEDILARYGGDEFAILITPLLDEQIISIIQNKIEAVISKPFDISGNKISLGMSIGVAIYPDVATSKEALFEIADQRMYSCKNAKI